VCLYDASCLACQTLETPPRRRSKLRGRLRRHRSRRISRFAVLTAERLPSERMKTCSGCQAKLWNSAKACPHCSQTFGAGPKEDRSLKNCAACGREKCSSDFVEWQWKLGDANRRCRECMTLKRQVPVAPRAELKRAKQAPELLLVDATVEESPVLPLRPTQALAVTSQRAMAPYGGWFGGMDYSRAARATRPKLASGEKPYRIRLLLGDARRGATDARRRAASVIEVPRYLGYDSVVGRALGDLGLSPESDRIVYEVPGCKIVGDTVVAPAYFESIKFDQLEKILDKVDELGLEGALKVCVCLQREAAALVAWIDDDEALTGKHDLLRDVHGEVFRKDRVKIRIPKALFDLRQSLLTRDLYKETAQADFNLVEDLSAKTEVRFGVELEDAIAVTPSPRRRGWARDGFVSHRSK